MVYKKYITRNGKTYGPYIYHSERVDGKVVSNYLGNKSKPAKKNFHFLWIALGVLGLLLLFFIGFQAFNQGGIHGKVSLDVETTYNEGEALDGILKLSLKKGELLPSNSQVIIEDSQGNSNEYVLSDLVSDSVVSGDYYVEGESISGTGEGYGSSGNAVIYPTVYFTLKISGEDSSGEEEEQETEEETEETEETGTEEEVEEQETEQEEEESTGTGNVIFNFFAGVLGNLNPTGQVSLDIETEVDGEVSGEEPFIYDLSPGQSVSVVSGSVRTDDEELSDSDIGLVVEEDRVTVTTDYLETSEGFGEQYLGNVDKELVINLSALDLNVAAGVLQIKVVYSGEEIVSSSVNLVSGETSQASNETILQNQTLLTNESVYARAEVFLTETEKQTLVDEFGANFSVNTTKAEVVNNRLFVKHELDVYWAEYTYKYSGSVTDSLKNEIERDKLGWLKDLSDALNDANAETEETESVDDLIGGVNINSIESSEVETLGNQTQETGNETSGEEIGNETQTENNESQ